MNVTPAELITTYFDHWLSGDEKRFEAAMEIWDDDVVVHYPGRNCFSGTYTSLKEVEEVLGEIDERGGSLVSDVYWVAGGEDHAVANYCEVMSRDGRTMRLVRTNVYRIKDEKIVEVRAFEEDQYAVDEYLSDEASA